MKEGKINYKVLLETQTTTKSGGGILTEENIEKAWDKSLAKWLIDIMFKGKKAKVDD